MATSPCQPTTLEQLVNPTDRQREFLQAIADKDFVLYGGEAGGGKSYILRWWLVLYLVWCYRVLGLRNVRVGLFCEDYPTLNDRQISKMQYEFPTWLGSLSRSGVRDFTLRPEYGGGVIALRNLDDPSKYYSAEFAGIAVDELTRNQLAVFTDLRFRLRWPGIDRPKFGAGTNPGGPGHKWVKKYWILQEFPPEMAEIAAQFVLVRAKASDNPHLHENYHKSLLTLPPAMAKQVARGDWDVYTGQYFPHFDPARHVIPHDEAMARIKSWHKRSLSGDWGYTHPHCFHWHAKDERDCIITYDELWDREIHENEVGRRITEAEAQYHKLLKLDGFVFSWDALGKLSARSMQRQPKTTGQLICETLGPRVPRPHPNDSSPGMRLVRARLMSQVLEAGTWLISDKCSKLIDSIPDMIRDEDHPEEMLKKDWSEAEIGDDPVDSAGMGLQWMIGTSIKPDSVKLEERLQAVRQTFIQRAEVVKPGTDWFQQFGGAKAKDRDKK